MTGFLQDWLMPLLTLGGVVVAIVLFITRKDSVHDIGIAEIKKDVKSIFNSITSIKDNHLFHIERDVTAIRERTAKTEQKLDSHINNHKQNEK